jgi:hypothetical protein
MRRKGPVKNERKKVVKGEKRLLKLAIVKRSSGKR